MLFHRCSHCLMPDTRPDTPFINGVCMACITAEKNKSIKWDDRKQELQKLFEKQKPNGSGFDCIVASSGGKDSHWQVKQLLDMGIKPLIVTATTCMLTKLGRYNIDNLKRYAPTIEVTPNQDVRAKLNRLGLELVGDVSWPEHVAIFTTPMRMAVALGIPLVFYGENPQAQYGGPKGTQEARQMTQRWVSEFGGFLGLRPADMVGREGITAEHMREYQFPEVAAVKKVKAEAHFLGQYIGPWDSHANAETAIRMGMRYDMPTPNNWWPWENLDNAMTGLHDWMMYRKYGYGRGCAQLSVDIRNGRIKRAAALDILRVKDREYPLFYADVHINDVCRRIGVGLAKLDTLVAQFSNEWGEA